MSIRKLSMAAAVIAVVVTQGTVVFTALLSVTPGSPVTYSNNTGRTTYTYDPSTDTGTLTISAQPLTTDFGGSTRKVKTVGSAGDTLIVVTLPNASSIGPSGTLSATGSLTIKGSIDSDGDGVSDFTGTLLTGSVTEFGFQDLGCSTAGLCTDVFDMRFDVTGGQLAGFYKPSLKGAVSASSEKERSGSFRCAQEDDPCFEASFQLGAKVNVGPAALCAGTIGDFVWQDTAYNGVQDLDEPGLNGVRVTLRLPDGTLLPTKTITFTAGFNSNASNDGYYQFGGLCAGQYLVNVDEDTLPSGATWKATAQGGGSLFTDSNVNPANVTLSGDTNSDQAADFGYVSDCSAELGDRVWIDTNRNGIQDRGSNGAYAEPGVDNIGVELRDAQNNSFDPRRTTTTDYGGYFNFTGLCAGYYSLKFTLPSGWAFTVKGTGDKDADSDANAFGDTGQVTVALGTVLDTWDAGLVPPPHITLVLQTNGADANNPDGADVPVLAPGEPVTWTYVVTNDGLVDIQESDLVVSDNIGGIAPQLVVEPASQDGILQPDESWRYVASGEALDLAIAGLWTIQAAKCHQGGANPAGGLAYVNWGTAEVVHANVRARDASSYCNPNPKVALKKYTNGKDANDPNGADVPVVAPGEDVTWTYVVTNTGPITMTSTDVRVTDSVEGPITTLAENGNGDEYLSPGEVWTFSLTKKARDLWAESPSAYTRPGCAAAGSAVAQNAYVNVGMVTIPGDTAQDPSSYCSPARASIGDTVWHDVNGDGTQSSGEPGLSNVSVTLLDATGAMLKTVTTDAQGAYTFTGLKAGSYTIQVSAPSGYTPTTPNAPGSTPSNDSEPTPALVSLPTDTTTDVSTDFGFRTACSGRIGDFTWADADGDGVQESGDAPLGGVTVTLTTSANTVRTTTSDQSGSYQFTGLCAGTYTVTVSTPARYVLTATGKGTDVTDSNGNSFTVTLATDTSADPTVDFGFVASSRPVGTGTPGYWMNHPDAWPDRAVVVGHPRWYERNAAIGLMKAPTRKDMTYALFQALVAAKLNVRSGCERSCIESTIDAVDAWMAKHPVGSGVPGGSRAWAAIKPLHARLDDYNNGRLCAPHRD